MTRYDKFAALCKEHGYSVTSAMLAAGLSKSLAAKWKRNPDYSPNAVSLSKLCGLFNVSADYFLDEKNDNYTTYKDMPEITMIARAGKKMTPQQRQEILHYAQYLYPDAFKD